MTKIWATLVIWLEVLQGARPPARRGRWVWIGFGLWWMALLLLVLVASVTRTSRFIYVDF